MLKPLVYNHFAQQKSFKQDAVGTGSFGNIKNDLYFTKKKIVPLYIGLFATKVWDTSL